MKTLVVAPAFGWVPELQMFEGAKMLELDALLMSGFSGVYFRRLRVKAALHPAMRVVYETKRRIYLQRVLGGVSLPNDVVVIGSSAGDVDLLDFDEVCAVKLADRGMRAVSKIVYGDPVMLCLEYAATLHALDEAVDEWCTVTAWREIPLMLMRRYPTRQECVVQVAVNRQKAILADILAGEDDASVYLEDSLHLDMPVRRSLFIADYDYLVVIQPVWRDAVVKSLGSAPSIVDVFRLPWFMVDASALNMMCFRDNIHGRPSVSARGHSLVEFVRTRLSTFFTTRELVGTWVGALLCDEHTAIDTIASLGNMTLAPVGDASMVTAVRPEHALYVPLEYAWAYAAVPDVCIANWDGERKLDGAPRLGTGRRAWVNTLDLVELYSHAQPDPLLAAAVVWLLQRLHTSIVDDAFVTVVTTHAADVVSDGVRDHFDSSLTPFLPGYGYLFCFVPSVRHDVLEVLGCHPAIRQAMAYANRTLTADGLFSVSELCADLSAMMLYAGRSLFDTGQLVGYSMKLNERAGFCYECLFQEQFRPKVRRKLGAYPTLQCVMSDEYIGWRIDNALDLVYVSGTNREEVDGHLTLILHMSSEAQGVTLRRFLQLVRTAPGTDVQGLSWRVGQAPVCYNATWYVAAIIAWTIVGVCLLFAIAWCWYQRSGSGGRRTRR